MPRPICTECKQDECEQFEDMDGQFYDSRCGRCNDVLIERANRRREWNRFHPGEPMPKSEQ